LNIPVLLNATARHIFLSKHGLVDAPSGSGKGADLQVVIDDLGFVQLDSVNTFARAHDLILWSRRQQYRPAHLSSLLTEDRGVFEHWTHDASAISMDHFVHWRLKFARDAAWLESRWKEWRRDDFTKKIDEVLRQISDEGHSKSGDVGKDEVRRKGGWWDWHPSKTALEYLWRSGQISVVRRDGFTKVYDLTERVIPPERLNARVSEADTVNWACNAAIDKLGFATSGEIAAFWAMATPTETRAWCKAALADGEIIEVDVEGVDGKLRRSFARPDVMDIGVPAPSPRVRILSPFDPALRDRKRAERLFGFHYRIEIFVPAPKRQYGYYVFPVMEGDRLIGRIDMKADRPNKQLNVIGFWPEVGVSMAQGRLDRIYAELVRAARFGGCDDVVMGVDWLKVSV
jgi:uncharacterized protein YcaQ